MSDNNGDTISLAEHRRQIREAYVEGRMVPITPGSVEYRAECRAYYEAEALARWPEPEPPLRWVRADDGVEYARRGADDWVCRSHGAHAAVNTDDERIQRLHAHYARLASLLPNAAAPGAATPTWWGVVDKHGRLIARASEQDAEDLVVTWNKSFVPNAPHRVVALVEASATRPTATITDEMVEQALQAYHVIGNPRPRVAMRAALEAVAEDMRNA